MESIFAAGAALLAILGAAQADPPYSYTITGRAAQAFADKAAALSEASAREYRRAHVRRPCQPEGKD